MIRLLLCLLLLSAGYSLGTAVLSRCPRLVLDGWPRKVLYRLGLGLPGMAYVVLGLGLLGWLRPAVGWLVVLLALGSGIAPLRREFVVARRMRAKTAATPLTFGREYQFPNLDGLALWPRWATVVEVLVLVVLILGAFLIANLPPAAYDDLTYHLAAPKVFARTGQVSILPYDHHTAFPFTLEMLYTLALLIGDAPLAKLIHFSFWLLTLLAVRTLGNEHFGPRVGRLATLCYAATPIVYYEAGTAYNEFGFALYQLLAWLAFLEYLNHRATRVALVGGVNQPAPRQPQWAWLVGICGGLTIGCKLTGGLLVIFLLGAALWLGLREKLGSKVVVRDLLIIGLSATLVAAPWLLRTGLTTGDPFFPFGYQLFQSPQWSADRAAMYQSAQHQFGQQLNDRFQLVEPDPEAHRSWSRFPLAPWNLTCSPSWYYDRGLNFDGKANLGPVYLAFAPLAMLLWAWLAWRRVEGSYEELREETTSEVYSPEFRREVSLPTTSAIEERITIHTPRAAGLLLAYGLFVGVFWFATMQYARYLVPHLALLAVLCAWVADGLLRLRLAAFAAGLVLVMQLVGGLSYERVVTWPGLRVLTGDLSREQYAAGSLPAFAAMQWLNDHTSPTDKVVLYGEPRGYWLDRDYLWGERGHSTLIPDAARSDMQTYVDCLTRQLGVTYALVYEPLFPTTRAEGTDDVALVSQAIAAGRFEAVWQDPRRGVVVYAVR